MLDRTSKWDMGGKDGRRGTREVGKYCMVAYECNIRHCAHVYHSNLQLTL